MNTTNKGLLNFAYTAQAIQEFLVIKSDNKRNVHLNKGNTRINNLQDEINNNVIKQLTEGNVNKYKITDIRSEAHKIVKETLYNDAKSYQYNTQSKNIQKILQSNAKIYSEIVSNRLINNSNDIRKATEKLFKETSKSAMNKTELKDVLKNEFVRNKNNSYSVKYVDKTGRTVNTKGMTAKQIKKSGLTKKKILSPTGIQYRKINQIIGDAIHTNTNALALEEALNMNYGYKIWMNGRSRGKSRAWHRAKLINGVEIDEPFEIYGSYKAYMMYPGDLAGGAENVANCHCYLDYTDSKPDNYKKSSRSNSGSKSSRTTNKDKVKNSLTNLIPTTNKPQTKTNIALDSPRTINYNNRTYVNISNNNKNIINKQSIKSQSKEIVSATQIYTGKGDKALRNNNAKQYKELIKILKTKPTFVNVGLTFEEYKQYSDKIVPSAKKLKENIIVTRREQTDYMISKTIEGIYVSESLLSTSISRNKTDYGEYIHDILIKKGTKVPYLEDISMTPKDMEVLLPKGSKLKLIKNEGKYYLWEFIK